MVFEGSMGLYLLVKKMFRGQRLGNVGLNIDENIRNRGEPHGLEAFSRRTRTRAAVFLTKIGLSKEK